MHVVAVPGQGAGTSFPVGYFTAQPTGLLVSAGDRSGLSRRVLCASGPWKGRRAALLARRGPDGGWGSGSLLCAEAKAAGPGEGEGRPVVPSALAL